jgi:hypothetical protein
MSLGVFYWPVENGELWRSYEVGAIEVDCDDQNVPIIPRLLCIIQHSLFLNIFVASFLFSAILDLELLT